MANVEALHGLYLDDRDDRRRFSLSVDSLFDKCLPGSTQLSDQILKVTTVTSWGVFFIELNRGAPSPLIFFLVISLLALTAKQMIWRAEKCSLFVVLAHATQEFIRERIINSE